MLPQEHRSVLWDPTFSHEQNAQAVRRLAFTDNKACLKSHLSVTSGLKDDADRPMAARWLPMSSATTSCLHGGQVWQLRALD